MAGKPTERASCFFDEGNIGEAPVWGHYSPSDRDVKEAYGDLCEMCKTSRLVSKFLSSVIFVYNLLTHHGD